MRCFRSGLSGEYSVWYKLYIVVNFYYSIGKHYLKMRCFGSGLSGEYSIWYKLYIVVNFLLQHWEALFKDEVFWQWVVR